MQSPSLSIQRLDKTTYYKKKPGPIRSASITTAGERTSPTTKVLPKGLKPTSPKKKRRCFGFISCASITTADERTSPKKNSTGTHQHPRPNVLTSVTRTMLQNMFLPIEYTSHFKPYKHPPLYRPTPVRAPQRP